MRLLRWAALISASISLQGCYSMQGPERLVTNAATPYRFADNRTEMFIEDFKAAVKARRADPDADNPHVAPMLRSGFMYNYAFCQGYFQAMAKNQRKTNVTRSAIAPIATLITGIIGLQNFSSSPEGKEDIVQGLAIGSAFATSALNIYDQHFLFGAENVHSVETLTLRAVNMHGKTVLQAEDIGFEDAMMHLIDNQNQCTPQAILTLVRGAINTAKLGEDGSAGSDGPAGGGAAPPPPPPPRPTAQQNGGQPDDGTAPARNPGQKVVISPI